MLPGLPLSRFAIVESHFIITAHHAIYDAWSLNWLLEDVVAAYQQQSLETHVPYKHFIKHVQELDQKASESFWTSELSNENTKIFPSIPYPKYQPKADTFLVQDIQFSRKPESEITTPTILEAAWALVSSQYTGDTDVTFGLLVSGRNASLPGVTGIRGPTIATVPVQVRIDHDLSLETFLRQIQNQITEMMPFEQTGLQRIRRLNTATEAAYDFQTQLVIQASGTTRTGLQPLGINRTNDDSDDVLTYALTFECVLTSTGLTLNTLFDSDIIPSSQMKRIIQQFANLVQALSEESFSTTVNDILIINAQDEKEILTWNSTLPEFVEKIVHEEIQQQALTHPDAPAICAWDGDLTYKELDILSSQLGYFLRSMV
jgi:non-ribosomal peptide synthetase component F